MAFEQLHTLQLVSPDGGGGNAKALESGGGLRGLRKLSLGMEMREVVQVLELCGAVLREAHFVHMGESGTPIEWSAVTEVLARRCRNLSAVSLDAAADITRPAPRRLFRSGVAGWAREDITKLAVGCPDIRDLRFSIDLDRWSFESHSSGVGFRRSFLPRYQSLCSFPTRIYVYIYIYIYTLYPQFPFPGGREQRSGEDKTVKHLKHWFNSRIYAVWLGASPLVATASFLR